jgi:hypothetical protein
MSIIDDIAAALGPVVRELGVNFGCTVAIYRPVVADTADGTPTRTYPTVDPAWSEATAFFEPGSTSGDGSEAVAKPFGVRTTAFGVITFTQNASGAIPVISPFDGFKILTGPFAGYTWLAEADHVPDGIAASGVVRVTAAPAGVIP